MPTVSIYLREEVYLYLAERARLDEETPIRGKVASVAKKWIEERYEKEHSKEEKGREA